MRKFHTISALDLYNNYDVKKIKGNGNIRKIYKAASKKVLAAKVFLRFLEMVINDFVNGDTFHLPTKNVATFSFEAVKGDNFKRIYRSGKFPDLDFLISNFTMYFPIFRYFYGKTIHKTSMVLSDNYKKIINEKINSGFKYA